MLPAIQNCAIRSNYSCAQNLRKQNVSKNNETAVPNNSISFSAGGNSIKDNTMRNVGLGLFAITAFFAAIFAAHQAGFLNKISSSIESLI